MIDPMGAPRQRRARPRRRTMTGRGRPPTGVRVDIRIPAEDLEHLDRIATHWACSRAHVLRLTITMGLEEWAKTIP